MRKALVAMSGGVDSSVAVLLLQEAGHTVSGVTMRLSEDADDSAVRDAQAVATKLGCAHSLCDYRSLFREAVIGDFSAAYARGETPNPCVRCNQEIKFGALQAYREAQGYDMLATGHYARIERDSDGLYRLRKAADRSKDQSYFLYTLSQAQLAHTLFPLGGLRKAEVRRLALAHGLASAGRAESQDICFVPDGDYAAFLERERGCRYPPGDFVDGEDMALGQHRGIIHYTIGQRRGLGLALRQPMYVSAIDAEHNRIVLGSNAALLQRQCRIRCCHWIAPAPPSSPFRAAARIRYRHQEAPALITPLDTDRADVLFDEAQRAITPGQSLVLYDGEYVLGGGILC